MLACVLCYRHLLATCGLQDPSSLALRLVDVEPSRIPPKELCDEGESESIVVKIGSSSHRSCQTKTPELHAQVIFSITAGSRSQPP
jgi:hypothetical protein